MVIEIYEYAKKIGVATLDEYGNLTVEGERGVRELLECYRLSPEQSDEALLASLPRRCRGVVHARVKE